MPRTVPLSAPRDNPFARYPSSRFTREENPPDEEELFLDEVSEENPQDKTSLSNCRKKISFIPPLALKHVEFKSVRLGGVQGGQTRLGALGAGADRAKEQGTEGEEDSGMAHGGEEVVSK